MMSEQRNGGRNSAELKMHLKMQPGGRERHTHQKQGETFETSKPIPSDSPPSTRSHLLIFPKQFHQLGPSIKIYEPMEGILIQTPHIIKQCRDCGKPEIKAREQWDSHAHPGKTAASEGKRCMHEGPQRRGGL